LILVLRAYAALQPPAENEEDTANGSSRAPETSVSGAVFQSGKPAMLNGRRRSSFIARWHTKPGILSRDFSYFED
jgi:hypothetical protein